MVGDNALVVKYKHNHYATAEDISTDASLQFKCIVYASSSQHFLANGPSPAEPVTLP